MDVLVDDTSDIADYEDDPEYAAANSLLVVTKIQLTVIFHTLMQVSFYEQELPDSYVEVSLLGGYLCIRDDRTTEL